MMKIFPKLIIKSVSSLVMVCAVLLFAGQSAFAATTTPPSVPFSSYSILGLPVAYSDMSISTTLLTATQSSACNDGGNDVEFTTPSSDTQPWSANELMSFGNVTGGDYVNRANVNSFVTCAGGQNYFVVPYIYNGYHVGTASIFQGLDSNGIVNNDLDVDASSIGGAVGKPNSLFSANSASWQSDSAMTIAGTIQTTGGVTTFTTASGYNLTSLSSLITGAGVIDTSGVGGNNYLASGTVATYVSPTSLTLSPAPNCGSGNTNCATSASDTIKLTLNSPITSSSCNNTTLVGEAEGVAYNKAVNNGLNPSSYSGILYITPACAANSTTSRNSGWLPPSSSQGVATVQDLSPTPEDDDGLNGGFLAYSAKGIGRMLGWSNDNSLTGCSTLAITSPGVLNTTGSGCNYTLNGGLSIMNDNSILFEGEFTILPLQAYQLGMTTSTTLGNGNGQVLSDSYLSGHGTYEAFLTGPEYFIPSNISGDSSSYGFSIIPDPVSGLYGNVDIYYGPAPQQGGLLGQTYLVAHISSYYPSWSNGALTITDTGYTNSTVTVNISGE